MNARNLVGVLAMVLVAALSLVYLVALGLPIGRDIGTRTAKLRVAQSNGLVTGSKVLYRGVEIGRVTAVRTSLDSVDISWNYRDEYSIPAASRFRIDNLSALGETYIGIEPPSTPHRTESPGVDLADGAVVAADHTEVPTTVDELSARVVRLLQQIRTDDVDDIVAAINEGLVGDREVLTSLRDASSLLETTIVATRLPLSTLLEKFQELLVRGAGVSDALAASRDGLTTFGDEFAEFLNWCVKFVVTDNLPTELTDGAGPLLENALSVLNRAAPDIKILGDALLPTVSQSTARLRGVDLSQLMRVALATAGTGDGITVRVGGK